MSSVFAMMSEEEQLLCLRRQLLIVLLLTAWVLLELYHGYTTALVATTLLLGVAVTVLFQELVGMGKKKKAKQERDAAIAEIRKSYASGGNAGNSKEQSWYVKDFVNTVNNTGSILKIKDEKDETKKMD